MPSDPRVLEALALFAEPIGRFRSAISTTLEEVRGELASIRSDTSGQVERLKTQLGRFAEGRVDVSRLTAVIGSRAADPAAQQRLEAAYDTLQDVAAHGNDLFCVHVPPGSAAGIAIGSQLAAIGRAFGAARIAASARGIPTTLGMSDHQALGRFPFAEWSAAERRLAPPLVVSVTGRDLNAAALARFFDGALKVVLVVDGPCAPAPLVRLVTPNVFVTQVHEVSALAPLAAWPGAGIGAVLPPMSSVFTHDPAAGPELWQRLAVTKSRDGHLGRLGGLSAAQQTEEILQLEALAARPSSVAEPAHAPGTVREDPAGRLAAWLLHQADLAGTPEA
jgi:hypothetical protein